MPRYPQQFQDTIGGRFMHIAFCSTLFLSTLLFISSAAIAAECSGSWQVLRNYNPGSGGVCASLGLNTHQAVCQAGQRYATYCDDASGGRYRTCQSSILCSRDHRNNSGNGGFRDNSENSRNDRWDFRDVQRDDHRDCTQWDFTANRPCAYGTINRDCQKGCDGR